MPTTMSWRRVLGGERKGAGEGWGREGRRLYETIGVCVCERERERETERGSEG